MNQTTVDRRRLLIQFTSTKPVHEYVQRLRRRDNASLSGIINAALRKEMEREQEAAARTTRPEEAR